ncbi:MAG TPA: class I SAM-dependent methyltransferase, partial [Archangium sp.]
MPAWLLTDIKEHQRTVCIDQCGVGRELGDVQRVLAGASLVGLDASEEAIVEARRRYPDYRFRVDTADFDRAFDVCVQLEATVQRSKLGPALARLAGMSRRAVVVTLAEGSIAPGDLPLVIGDGFSLVHAERAGDARQWLVATWVHAEIAALYALPAGESLPALLS